MEDIVFSRNLFAIGPTDPVASPGAILDVVVGSATFIAGTTPAFAAGQPKAMEPADEFRLRTFPREKISIS